MKRLAEGSGHQRKRVDPEIPVYGKVNLLHSDELAVLKLPPKWALFPVVKMQDVKIKHSCAKFKARYDRIKNRDLFILIVDFFNKKMSICIHVKNYDVAVTTADLDTPK